MLNAFIMTEVVTTSSTELNKHQREEGNGRSRCGACLFELPGDVTLIPEDSPLEEDFIPKTGPLGPWYSVPISTFSISMERGCKICQAIISEFTRHLTSLEGTSELLWSLDGITKRFDVLQVFVSDDQVPGLKHPFRLPTFTDAEWRPSGDTRSAKAFSKVRNWIQKCTQEHQLCTQVSGSPMPERLLFIENISPLTVRLKEGANLLQPQPYACLSYRWGPETKTSSLTKATAELFRKRIPQKLLYPILQHALEITNRLGLQYLWVDSLCIYQDDLTDWHRQASEMASIYRNGAFTISALSCGDGPDERKIFSSKTPQSPIEICHHNGGIIQLRMISNNTQPFHIAIPGGRNYPNDEFPLLKRGWVYQERILSPRIIYFTNDEIFWECNEAFWSEHRFQEASWFAFKSLWKNTLISPWSSIMEEYSRTQLSHQSDRLPALSGVAKLVGEARGWTYLAGLWKEQLPDALLWMTYQPEARQQAKKIPTWSWASIMGSIKLLRFGVHEPLVTVVSHHLVPGQNLYGTPASAKLCIRGTCISATVYYGNDLADHMFNDNSINKDQCTHVLKLETAYYNLRPDYVFSTPDANHIPSGGQLLFMLGVYNEAWFAGLALRAVDGSDTYERVGMSCTWIWHSDRERIEMGEAWKERELTLI